MFTSTHRPNDNSGVRPDKTVSELTEKFELGASISDIALARSILSSYSYPGLRDIFMAKSAGIIKDVILELCEKGIATDAQTRDYLVFIESTLTCPSQYSDPALIAKILLGFSEAESDLRRKGKIDLAKLVAELCVTQPE